MADAAGQLQQLGRALTQLSEDDELLETLRHAVREQDVDAYRTAIGRLPLSDAPGACRLIGELVGHSEEGGEWEEVCELPHPKKVKGSLTSDQELAAIAALRKSERYGALYDLYRRHDLLECHHEYKPAKLQPYYWCETVCAPEPPWGPIGESA